MLGNRANLCSPRQGNSIVCIGPECWECWYPAGSPPPAPLPTRSNTCRCPCGLECGQLLARHFDALLERAIAHQLALHLVHRVDRSEEHTSELQSLAYLVCRLLLEKKKK